MGPFWALLVTHPLPFTSPLLCEGKSLIRTRKGLLWTSVNDAVHPYTYLGVDVLLTVPTIDNVTKGVTKFGKGSFIAKIDITQAFKHVPIDPKDTNLPRLHWEGTYILS